MEFILLDIIKMPFSSFSHTPILFGLSVPLKGEKKVGWGTEGSDFGCAYPPGFPPILLRPSPFRWIRPCRIPFRLFLDARVDGSARPSLNSSWRNCKNPCALFESSEARA